MRRKKFMRKKYIYIFFFRQYANMGRVPNCLQPCCPLGGNLPGGNVTWVMWHMVRWQIGGKGGHKIWGTIQNKQKTATWLGEQKLKISPKRCKNGCKHGCEHNCKHGWVLKIGPKLYI